MTSDIKISNSQLFTWDTSLNPTEYRVVYLPGMNYIPDIAVLRQISYFDVAPNTNFGQYFVWCSLTNNYIGSFCVADNTSTDPIEQGQSMFVTNPQSIITNPQSVASGVTFRIDKLVNGSYTGQTGLDGIINIQIDFLKFKERS